MQVTVIESRSLMVMGVRKKASPQFGTQYPAAASLAKESNRRTGLHLRYR